MDGKEALDRLYDLLSEDHDSNFISRRMALVKLNEAAYEFTEKTECLKATQTITLVPDQANYSLNANFMNLYLRNKSGNLYIKYNDGMNDSFITWKDYEDIVYQNSSESARPSRFCIIDDPNLDTRISSTCTTSGANVNGESVLTDSAADFSDVSAGDVVHNLTDGSDGYVLSSGTTLTTAMFGGSSNAWTSSDSYIIQPQGRIVLVLDPAPDTADTVTINYIQRPAPVYSDFGAFRFQPQHMSAIIKYAAWLEKYKDQEPDFGDAWYAAWEQQTRRHAFTLNKTLNRRGFEMNLKARR